ncbi:hypothetical protein PFISCL1PPCAC_11409 [Pristionchus fissidentatus]|uniref:Tonsoku-like protein n=1 Tax=Pristionchus fissidentatus TaxID=1538716 RepID=A0AAV5VPZ6_9BILA|nr:hypothetical protein PFISCL1PPCAC_11409 [Pristionchus fissidentatus]
MKKEEKIIHELKRSIEVAERSGDYVKQSDKCVELFTQLRAFERLDEAKTAAIKARRVADMASVAEDVLLSVRGCAEISAEQGDEAATVKYLKEYEDLARNNPTELQLMLTVGAWCLLHIFSIDDRRERLTTARLYAEKSLEMLKTQNMDHRKLRAGETFGIREIHCLRMLAGSAGNMGDKDAADKYSKRAHELAKGNKELSYDIVRSWLDFPWRNRIQVAEELVRISDSGKKRVESHIWLADALLRGNDIEKGIDSLFAINEIVHSKGGEEEQEKFPKLLILAYKAQERMRRIQKCGDNQTKFHEHDKMGDLFNEAGYKEAALAHYQMALDLADTQERKRDTLVSCAETASDLKKHKEAAGYFDRVKMIEFALGKDTTETMVSIFKSRLLGQLFDSDATIQCEVDRLEKIPNNRYLDVVYEAVGKHFASKGQPKEAERFKQLEEAMMESNNGLTSDDDDDSDENMPTLDDIDRRDDQCILEEMRKRARDRAKIKALEKAGKKENMYGESKLMEISREGTLEQAKILVKQGHDVNKPDPVGWTPLSEAVGANNLDMVKYLLSKGANPKSQSKTGWSDTHFGGKITPLMEACTNGFHEIATWLLQSDPKVGMTLVVDTNVDGWSSADFLSDYLKRAARGDESENDFQAHFGYCKNLLTKIKEMQRRQGFPVRVGDPPAVLQKSDDTPRFAKEKEATTRAMRRETRKGAAENYRDTMTSIGSRSKYADKKEKKKKRKESEDEEEDDNEDIFNDSDDEPLVRPSSSGSASSANRRVRLSSESDVEEELRREKEKENKMRRKSIDQDEFNFGLDDDCGRRSSLGGKGATPKLTGVQRILQKKNQKRSMERGDENGISIVPDADVMYVEERRETKRRRNESEGSQSGSSPSFIEPPRVSISSTRDLADVSGGYSAVSSPVGVYRTESRSSLTSASMLASTAVRVVVVKGGERKNLLRSFPSDTDVAKLPAHFDKLKEMIDGAPVEWKMGEDTLDSITVGDLTAIAEKLPIEIECIVKRTLKAEFEKRCDPSDQGSDLSAALDKFEKSRLATLSIDNGPKYSEQSREALWSVLTELIEEKEKEGTKWRMDSIRVEQWDLSSSAVRCLVRLPSESLSLRWSGIDDVKLVEMLEALSNSGTAGTTLKTLDLSYNDGITSSDALVKLLRKMSGINNLILQGCTGIEDGKELMRAIGEGLSLHSLILDENPWLDDGSMGEFMRAEKTREGRLSTLKMSKCSLRSMLWLEEPMSEAFKSLKTLSVAENNAVGAPGWERVSGFLRSASSGGLRSIDLSGTNVRSTILDALVARSPSCPIITATLTRCTWITSSEIYRIFFPVLAELVSSKGSLNLKLAIESKKVQEVRDNAPNVADKVLKIAPGVL